MLKLFIAVVAVALIYWVWTKKNQILPKRNDESEPFITTIALKVMEHVMAGNLSKKLLLNYHMSTAADVKPPSYFIPLRMFFKELHLLQNTSQHWGIFVQKTLCCLKTYCWKLRKNLRMGVSRN